MPHKKCKKIKLVYYATDSNLQNYSLNVPNSNTDSQDTSSIIVHTLPFFNQCNNKVAGNIKININESTVDTQTIGNYTQTFATVDGSMTFAYDFVASDNQPFFPDGYVVRLNFLYGSGVYFGKNITGGIAVFNDTVQTRKVSLKICCE